MPKKSLLQEERGVWISVAAILMVTIFIASSTIYYTTTVPKILYEEEMKKSKEIETDFTRMQQLLNEMGVGETTSLTAPSFHEAPGFAQQLGKGINITPSPTFPSVQGAFAPVTTALSSTDSEGSSVGVISHRTKRDLMVATQRSDNGLGENIYVDEDGVVMLENNWWGNKFITNTFRERTFEITAYNYQVDMRFVAQNTGTIENARVYVYVYDSNYPALKVTYTDGRYDFYYPTQDTTVKSGVDNAVNFGIDDVIQAGASTTKNYRTLLKFDLRRIPADKTISTAAVYLSASSVTIGTGASAPVIDAHSVASDSWDEDTVNWNNQPAYGAVLDTTTVSSGSASYTWNVTNFINTERSGDGIASILLKHTTESVTASEYAYFSANEHLGVRMWIAEDINGKPGDIVDNGNQGLSRFPRGGIWSSAVTSGWVYADNLNARVTAGNVYHLIVLAEAGYNYPNVYSYYAVAFGGPRNDTWVDGGIKNENRGALFYGRENPDVNVRWVEFPNNEPLYVLGYSTPANTWEGNPYHAGFKFYSSSYYYWDTGQMGDDGLYVSYLYSDYEYSAGMVMSDSASKDDFVWGENFFLSSPQTVTAFEVPIARAGIPGYNLTVRIENTTWGESFTLKPNDVSAEQKPTWYRFNLSQPRTMSGRYWVYLRVKGYTKYDYFLVPLDNATLDNALGSSVNLSWDGSTSKAFRAQMPDNKDNLMVSGSYILPRDYADMPFRLIYQNYKSPGAYTSPVVTPGRKVKWMNLTWDNVTPAGTSVKVEVRMGDTTHPPGENPNVTDDPIHPWTEWKEVQKGQDIGDIFSDNRLMKSLQYRVVLSSTNPALTPKVWNIQTRYFDSVGTWREVPDRTVIHTMNGDFNPGLSVPGTDNVSVVSGAVKLYSIGGEGWDTTLNYPADGVGEKNGHRIATIGGYVYMWTAYGGTPGTDSVGDTSFSRYDPSTNTWSSDWNATYTETVPFSTSYGQGIVEAKDPSGNWAIYALGGSTVNNSQTWYRWTEQAGWVALSTTIPWGGSATQLKPRNGSEFVWDEQNTLYYFPGSGYSYTQYDWYKYTISTDTWTYMGEAPTKNGPGNSGKMVKIGSDNYIYLHFGWTPSSDYTFAQFWRYRLTGTPGWEQLTKGPYGADDGSDLLWDGGDFLYHFPGAYTEGLAQDLEGRFLRYSISGDSWEDLTSQPYVAEGGSDDGGSAVMIGGAIYRLKGGSDIPVSGGSTAANEFWKYSMPDYENNGTYISQTIDMGEVVSWRNVSFENVTMLDTTLTLYVRFDNTASWIQVNSENSLNNTQSRYIQYRADFAKLPGANAGATPIVRAVTFNYKTGELLQAYSWTQTDWSGSSGQLAWSDTKRYYDNSGTSGKINVGDLVLIPGAGDNLWGDNFLVDTTLGSDNINLGAERLSLRFRARRDENVYGVKVNVYNYNNASIAAKIHRDNVSSPGNPGESITAENSVEIAGAGWNYIGFGSPAVLVKDNVYHIVMRMVEVTENTNWWTQTTWVGGPGLQNWSLDNRFYENDNVNWSLVPGKLRADNVTSITPPSDIAEHVVISEVGPTSTPGEYVELYNPTSAPINMNGWYLDMYAGDYTFGNVDIAS
ncbi:MAG: DNRLRE domain-containing protein, partial [Candidatus Hadarchaeota archaeon]